MKKILALLVLPICLVFHFSHAYAQTKVVRGEGTATVQGVSATGPTDEDRNTAMKTAKLMAWRNYLAIPGQDEIVDQIRANEKSFLDKLDDLLVDIVTVEDYYDNKSNRYTVRIKAIVAESVVNSMIRVSSKASMKGQAADNPAASHSGSSIAILGMAREADVVKSFMEKETKLSETSSSKSAKEATSVKGGNGGKRTVATDDISADTMQTTGGSREQKRDKITYKVGNVSILNNKLPRILLQSGIKSTPYAFLMRPCKLPNPDSFSKKYAGSEQGELPSDVMAEIQEKLLTCGKAKYWVFASMDVGGYKTDPNTGLSLVTVTVNVQLMEVETGAQIASASKDVPGRSADQSDAMRVATEGAVQAVGDIIAAQVANIGK